MQSTDLSKQSVLPDGVMVCTNCYAVGSPSRIGPGAITACTAIALTLVGVLVTWVALIIAVLLAIYYTVARKTVCASCAPPALVPPGSPRGQEILSRRG